MEGHGEEIELSDVIEKLEKNFSKIIFISKGMDYILCNLCLLNFGELNMVRITHKIQTYE